MRKIKLRVQMRKIKLRVQMRKIKLTQGYFAIVSNKDFARLNKFSWHIFRNKARNKKHNIYARRSFEGKKIFMHWDVGGYKFVDHKDGNCLNNRRSNLRKSTPFQNNCNKIISSVATLTGYKGVTLDPRMRPGTRRFTAYIKVNRKIVWRECFRSLISARKARLEALPKYHGDFARWK